MLRYTVFACLVSPRGQQTPLCMPTQGCEEAPGLQQVRYTAHRHMQEHLKLLVRIAPGAASLCCVGHSQSRGSLNESKAGSNPPAHKRCVLVTAHTFWDFKKPSQSLLLLLLPLLLFILVFPFASFDLFCLGRGHSEKTARSCINCLAGLV